MLLAGCSSLVPKKVEFFQDKVKAFPEQTANQRELEREALQRAYQKSSETVMQAVVTDASTNVVAPARETERLIGAVATTVGPPKNPVPATVPSEVIATRLETAVAKLNDTIQSFKIENNHNIGKKIEGTGLIEVGYVYWVGGVIGVLALLFFLGRTFLSVAAAANPIAAAGLTALNTVGAVAHKGASEVVSGVETLASTIEKEVQDLGLKQKLLDALAPTQAAAAHTSATLQSMSTK